MNMCLAKVQVTADMVGKAVFIPASSEAEKYIEDMGWGEFAQGNLRGADPRNVRQHNLFMACCEMVAENTNDENWDTQDKVLEQVKIAARWVETYYRYHNAKSGKLELNLKTKSISFDNMDQAEAHGFYNIGFDLLAAKLGITEDELKEAAVPRCKTKRVCPKCGKFAPHRHHKFSQTKQNRDKYGKLLDADFNIEYYCPDCHSSHAKLGSGDTWDEVTFIMEAVKAGHRPDDYVEPADWERTLRELQSKGLLAEPDPQ